MSRFSREPAGDQVNTHNARFAVRRSGRVL